MCRGQGAECSPGKKRVRIEGNAAWLDGAFSAGKDCHDNRSLFSGSCLEGVGKKNGGKKNGPT